MIAAVRATVPAGQLFTWQGEVLGGLAELSLWHTDEAAARRAMRKVEAEIARYEAHLQPRSGGERNLAAQCGRHRWRGRRRSCAR